MNKIKFRKKLAKFGTRKIITVPKAIQLAVEEQGPVFDIVLTPVKEAEA